jgi:hypothetical protein
MKMKWIGQHIYDLVARFRNDVYLEDLSTTTETNVLVVDSDGKVSKTTVITGDVTGITEGDNITVTDPTGPVPTVALNTSLTGLDSVTSTSFIGSLTGNAATATKIDSITNTDIVQLTGLQTLEDKSFSGGATFRGSTSGFTKIVASAVAGSTTLTLPAVTGTLATVGGTEILEGKTLTSPVISTPTGIVKGDVGLGNVDNTSDANKPVSTAGQTALDLKAPLASPNFTGNVGIGTASPEVKLQVGDGTDAAATRVYYSDNTYAELLGYGMEFSRASSYLRPTTDNTKTLYIGLSSRQWNTLSMDASTTTFNTNGSERMRITSTGNVGIGTTSPDALLEISGNAGADPGPITNPTTFRITDAGNAATGAGDVTNPWGKIEFYSEDISLTGPSVQAQIASVYNTIYSDSSDLNFYTRASPAVPLSTRMTIDAGGNVGIGTTGPSRLLHLDGVTAQTSTPFSPFLLNSRTTGNMADGFGGGVLFGINDATLTNENIIATIYGIRNGADNSGALTFNTYKGGVRSEQMRIDKDGNVGIGTSSPNVDLQIGEISTAYSGVPFGELSIGANNASIYVQGGGYGAVNTASLDLVGGYANVNVTNSIRIKGVRTSSGVGTNGSRLDFINMARGTEGDTLMSIVNSGNVGIGTTTPAQKLDVKDGFIQVSGTGPSGYGYLLNRAGQDIYSIRHLDGGLTIQNDTDSSRKEMTFNGTGNVGIGTGSPKNKLDIVGSLGRGAPVTKTTDFTVAATENWLIMNGTATITITLPTAAYWTGRELMIKNIAAYTVISASSNVKPIDTDIAATAILPATAGSWCTLVSDGTNWVTMMN